MDVHLHGACMGKLVGPAGGGGGGGGAGGVSTQFRVLPNSLSSDCQSVDTEKVPLTSHRAALHLRLSAPAPTHRSLGPDPRKIGGEEFHSGSNSPLPDIPAGFLLRDGGAAAVVRGPSLGHSSLVSPPSADSRELKIAFDDDDYEGAEALQPENLVVIE